MRTDSLNKYIITTCSLSRLYLMRGVENIMSIQQDKRVIKPSKMSERYARWFGTRVPSTSPMFRYIVMLALAVPWSFVSYLLLSTLFIDLILCFLLSCGAGVIIYLLFLSVIESRFRSSITDEPFSKIVELAHERVGSYGLVYVWQRKSSEPYIASTFNSLFNAVIVSEPMISLILEMPVSGEALLAYHLLHRPNHRNILDIVAAILIFSVFSINVAQMPLGYSSYYPFYYLLLLLTYSFVFILFVPVVLIILLRGAFWVHDSAFERAAGMYKIHPQVARDEVLSSTILDEEAAKSVVWVVKEWERRKRDGRRLSITAGILVIMYILIIELLALTGWFYYIYPTGMLSLILATPILLALLVYLFLRRWDKKCMGELFFKTKQADEPIWVD
jgi:hypothetical protein